MSIADAALTVERDRVGQTPAAIGDGFESGLRRGQCDVGEVRRHAEPRECTPRVRDGLEGHKDSMVPRGLSEGCKVTELNQTRCTIRAPEKRHMRSTRKVVKGAGRALRQRCDHVGRDRRGGRTRGAEKQADAHGNTDQVRQR